ncbi:MAG TPA: phospholipase D-like domain-containing protein [Candidatus Saccharimonadales bacterium]|nr:phospholipase D-like domain-containing protein [Candidatus Saccharimonadales bacterium]
MDDYTLLAEADYFREITGAIAETKRGDHVQLITMNFVPTDSSIEALVDQLIAAAKRGVSVEMVVDAHEFMVTSGHIPLGPLYWRRDILTAKHPRYFYEKTKALEALRAAGGHYTIINEPTTYLTTPIGGRSHIKATVINNAAYVGGCNLGHTGQIDYMIRLDNKAAVAWISQLITDIATHKHVQAALGTSDRQFNIDAHASLIVDVGVSDQSLILKEALELIDQARQWVVITCQLLPNSITAERLAHARQRGVNVYSIYNDPSQHTSFVPLAQYLIRHGAKLRYGRAAIIGQLPKHHQRLHAKLLATEQGAIIGSHNYLKLGVRLGTAEIAFLNRNPNFARSVVTDLISRMVVSQDYPLPVLPKVG